MSRGFAPVAVVLLLAITVLAAGAVAVTLPAVPGEPPPQRAITVDAASDGRITLTLVSGEPIDVEAATVRVTVDGDQLRHQPDVPYFATRGFFGTPSGPFNVLADPTWTVGESGTLRVASTNDPIPDTGDTLTVRVLVDGHTVATAETTVETATRD